VTVTFALAVSGLDLGDHLIATRISAGGPGGACGAGCTASTPVQSYTVTHSADSTVANPGATVTESVTVTNTGASAYPVGGAVVDVDLSGLLDDASVAPASILTSAGTAVLDGSTLTWSGPIGVGVGVSVTISYDVTLARLDTGDHRLISIASATAPGGGCVTVAACTAQVLVQSYSLSKAADTTVISPGAVITYSIAVTNTGAAPYSAIGATFTDDLSDVLDDASVVPGSITTTAGTATITGSTLNWAGPLAVAPAGGALAVVTYQVVVDDPGPGNISLTNTVNATGPGGTCVSLTGCAVHTPIASYRLSLASSGGSQLPGGVISYTATVTNTGTYAYPDGAAGFAIETSDQLDDGVVIDGSTTASTGTMGLVGSQLVWTGPLPVSGPGSSVTVTYQLRIDTPDAGNHRVLATLLPAASGGSCATSTACSAASLVQSYAVTVALSATTIAAAGDLTYTVTIENTGLVAYGLAAATARIDLAGVADDASYLPASASATGGTVQLSSAQVAWAGP
jgi:uncharacterized repeat protein (TIGR01451 family)